MNNIKNYFNALVLGAGLAFVFMALVSETFFSQSNAAVLSRGTTFTTNQQVEYTDLHALVDNATVSGVVSADITDGTIVAADISDSTITSVKIVDGTIVTGDILDRTILAGDISTNGVTETELNTNINFRVGSLTFTNCTALNFSNNQILSPAIAGITNSAGVGDAGKVTKVGPTGFLPSHLLRDVASIVTTNLVGTNIVFGAGYVYTTLAQLATTATTGSVIVKAGVCNDDPTSSIQFMRLRDSGNTVYAEWMGTVGSASAAMNAMLFDTLSGSTKTYILETAPSGAGTENYTNTLTSADSAAPVSDGFYIKIYQVP